MKMVRIPAGMFVMGTSEKQIARLAQQDTLAKTWKTKNYFDREQPQHTVTLAAYSIAQHPVTVGEYREFMEGNGYQIREYWTETGWLWRKSIDRIEPKYWREPEWIWSDRLPVVGVSWYEAIAFCKWLSEKSGKTVCLPTEAQWEKAGRGTDGRLYPWGEDFEIQYCNTRESHLNQTTPVDEFDSGCESPYGCVDMVGNASEWTQSEFRKYPYAGDDGRNEIEGEKLRVTRGGSWFKPKIRARVSARGMNDPFFCDNDLGFRYVCKE